MARDRSRPSPSSRPTDWQGLTPSAPAPGGKSLLPPSLLTDDELSWGGIFLTSPRGEDSITLEKVLQWTGNGATTAAPLQLCLDGPDG